MKIHWTRSAKNHLRAIYNHIALDSSHHARRLVDRITRRTELLGELPFSGAEVPEYGEPTIREVLYRSYRIIYRVRDDRIDVVAVIHGAQLLPDSPPNGG